MGSLPKEPWNYSPWFGDEKSYKRALFGYKALKNFVWGSDQSSDFSWLAQEFINDLSTIGYRGGRAYDEPLRERPESSYGLMTHVLDPYIDAHPVRWGTAGQRLWLRFGSSRSKYGYRNIEVAKEPPRTDKAILATVIALIGHEIDLKQLRKALSGREFPSEGNQMYSYVREVISSDPRAIQEMPNDDIEQALEWIKEYEPLGDLEHWTYIGFLLLLLSWHRPGFDDLPHEEKLAYIEQTCIYINEFLEALRRLTAFFEYGNPNRELRESTRQAERDVKAAVLRDVEGLTYLEIAKELGEPIPQKYRDKGEHPTIRQRVKRGRSILEATLGKEGWLAKANAMKAEAARWHSLSEEERRVEHVAELLFMTVQEAREFVKSEEELVAKEQEIVAESSGVEETLLRKASSWGWLRNKVAALRRILFL